MSCRFSARANVLASIVAILALTSACSDALQTPFDGPGDGSAADDTSFRRDGLPGNSRKNTVSSVEISPDGFSVLAGQQTTVTATIRNRNGQPLDRVVTWYSSDTTVASVTGGAVHALKAGTALVTASVDGVSDTATATITTISDLVDSVVVSPGTASLIVNQTLALTARPVDSAGTVVANHPVSWATSDPSIATVTPAGVVTGVSAGDASVRATADGNTSTVSVTVSPVPEVPVALVTVSPAPAALREGATLQLTAVTTDSAGTVLSGRTVTWASSNEHVAKVSASGLVSGIGAGSATITATSEGESASVTASVTASVVAVASVTMNRATASIAAGESLQLLATPRDAGGNPLTGRTIVWTSSNTSVASVSSSGLVTGVSGGTASVYATVDGIRGSTAVTVAQAPEPPADPAVHVGHYVSPSGSSGGSGTVSSPWDLASVLAGSRSVAAGDTVWVRGGTYRGEFISSLSGTASRQVVVRQYPGERATIDGNLGVAGSYVTYWGLEIMNSNPLANYKMGVNVRGPGNQFVNLVVHDAGSNGIGLWVEGPGSLVYGSLIYNNGTNGNKDHGIYTQNESPVKHIEDNIIFDNLAYGIHAYASIGRYANNLLIRGNVSFNNGTISSLAGRPDLFVGGETPSTGIVVDQNFLYRSDNGLTLRLGYAGVSEGTLTYTGNQVVGSTDIQSWSSISQSGNSVLSLTSKPSDTKVFVRPNRYEQGRANVIVYNWSHAGSVSADLSGVLDAGDRYEIRNAQNFYGAPVASGTYAGGSVAIPIVPIAPVMPIGRPATAPPSTGTEFGVYVVLKTS